MDEEIKEEVVDEEIDGRTALGKRLKKLENTQKEIQETLNEHAKKIDICSIQR